MLASWSVDDYSRLAEAFNSNSFHALLLFGASRSGGETVANKLQQYILCQSPTSLEPCERCSSCILYKEHNHPDLFILAADDSEERKTLSIKIEQIRELIDFAYRSTHLSTRQVIYLPRLEELNLNSSNALLKILEEPPQKCIFILQAIDIARVLPTIKSRCFKYKLQKPNYSVALSEVANVKNAEFWLRYYDGEPYFTAPFDDFQYELLRKTLQTPSIDNIFTLTKELDPKKYGVDNLLEFLLKWLTDLMQIAEGSPASYFTNDVSNIQKLATRLNKDKLYNLQSDIVFLLQWSNHPLNHKLQWENVLLKYQQLFA